MKKIAIVFWLLAASFLGASAQRSLCIDDGWCFALGSHPQACMPGYDDSGWRALDLPHDWSVEPEAAAALGDNVGPFSPHAIGGMQTGRTVGGEGWYRRAIDLSASDLEGRVGLYFEGAYNKSEVWVNGVKAMFNPYGYMPYKFDITPLCREGKNVIAVRVENEGNNTRWYAGSGIYRHVWLERTPASYLDPWQVKITACGQRVDVEVEPSGAPLSQPGIAVEIIDADGNAVGKADNKAMNAAVEVEGAKQWHPDHPDMYTARITLLDGAREVDQIDVPFGFRTIEVSPERGFVINGEPLLLRGGCVHHDLGLLGAAAHDGAEARKVALLKAQGYNALRCSHNLQSDNFMRQCDEQGIIVIDECFDQWQKYEGKNKDDYHNYFDQYGTSHLQRMVRRDRNHPSVCFWSLGNEIPERAEPCGIATAARLRQIVLDLDDSRPITAAIATWGNGPNVWEQDVQAAFRSLDVGGYNYAFDKYVSDHASHPQRVMMGTESYPMQIAQNWALVQSEPYVIGDFIWTAMDYVGEAGIGHVVGADVKNNFEMPWPWFNGFCGDIDLIGQKKPQSYFHDVAWGRAPIAMGVQPAGCNTQVSMWGWPDEYNSWTFAGQEGEQMQVNVYSSAPQVRLYLNGSAIGDCAPDSLLRARFEVAYAPGELRAVALDAEGREGAECLLATTGEPVGIRLQTEQWGDLTYVLAELVDADGRVVESHGRCRGSNWEENTGMRVAFEVEDGELVAAGNASPSDQASFRSATPRLWQGRVLAIVRGAAPRVGARLIVQ